MNITAKTPGFSPAARVVEDSVRRGVRSLQQSQVFGMESVVREELATVWEECRVDGWDGFSAMAVTREALRNAYRLLESLPWGFPAPSIGAEPDGQLTLEWHVSPRRTLSVSVSPEDELHFAGLFGRNRVHGTEDFFGEVPELILKLVRRVYTAC